MDRSTAKLVNRLTAMLVNCLTAKLVVVNLVKLHLTKCNKFSSQVVTSKGLITGGGREIGLLKTEIRPPLGKGY